MLIYHLKYFSMFPLARSEVELGFQKTPRPDFGRVYVEIVLAVKSPKLQMFALHLRYP